ncbi:hypothetical protein BaRGS_00029824 [Batillaria attramentaria]|uniref:Uncharacterized protein n=1 Tax=Batillaria attramentaria TaxID=370345 RepID=A0ABD0JV65_9CAEN
MVSVRIWWEREEIVCANPSCLATSTGTGTIPIGAPGLMETQSLLVRNGVSSFQPKSGDTVVFQLQAAPADNPCQHDDQN